MIPLDYPNLGLFSSLRYDPALLQSSVNAELSHRPGTPSRSYMLRYHRDRLLSAAKCFEWVNAVSVLAGPHGLTQLNQCLETEAAKYFGSKLTADPSTAALKIRILVDPTGTVKFDISPTPSVPLSILFPNILDAPSSFPTPPYIISLDTQPTTPSPFTKYKTTSRDMYMSARRRAGIHDFAETAEVLLVNPAGEIMEGSLTSPYFLRHGKWVTPSLESGGQDGTTRRWMLEQQVCMEGVVRAETLVDGETCWISNGVRGLILGRYVAKPTNA